MSGESLQALVSGLADPLTRVTAARDLARHLGGTDLLLFSPDPELGTLLPAPGLAGTLRSPKEWRALLAECMAHGTATARVEVAPASFASVFAMGDAKCVVALVGADPSNPAHDDALESITGFLPLLSRLFTTERILKSSELRFNTSASSEARSVILAQTLDRMRQRLEAALSQAQDARKSAEEANLAKSAFLATMSHELRTPLNAMLGYSDLLRMGVPVKIPAPAVEMVERIEISARHLLDLIEEILTFSKLEAGEEVLEIEDLPLKTIIGEVVALTEPLVITKDLAYETDVAVPDIVVSTDARKLRQILLNLLSNAAKFTSEGRVAFSAAVAGTRMIFEVTDTGPGIAPDEHERIFDPFWQSQSGHTRTAGGTGLGLTITRRLARFMGGDVTVVSELGAGSTFRVDLPLVLNAAE